MGVSITVLLGLLTCVDQPRMMDGITLVCCTTGCGSALVSLVLGEGIDNCVVIAEEVNVEEDEKDDSYREQYDS